MMSKFDLLDIIEGREKNCSPELIIQKKLSKFIAYFKGDQSKVGFGNTEIEALGNLKLLLYGGE